jgi:pimeloyl-ACP methyl ester carboxylesterase
MNIKQFAWVGDAYLNKHIQGVVIQFHGLGYNGMKQDADHEELELADAGALNVFPYYGPWSWMNKEACSRVNGLIEEIYTKYELSDQVPLILRGGSMGGMSALVYSCYAQRPVKACAVNCPVTDLPYHFTEREDLPRTLHQAFDHYNMPLEDAMKLHSPIHLLHSLPNIPYLFIHGDQDQAVNKQMHSDILTAEMKARGLSVDYIEAEGMGHCQYKDYKVARRMMEFVKSHLISL